jgi:hypothetical protein
MLRYTQVTAIPPAAITRPVQQQQGACCCTALALTAHHAEALLYCCSRGGNIKSPGLPLLVPLQLPAGAGACRCLCWHDTVVGLPPLLVTGHDQGGSIWAYCQRSMSWQVGKWQPIQPIGSHSIASHTPRRTASPNSLQGQADDPEMLGVLLEAKPDC